MLQQHLDRQMGDIRPCRKGELQSGALVVLPGFLPGEYPSPSFSNSPLPHSQFSIPPLPKRVMRTAPDAATLAHRTNKWEIAAGC